MSISTSPSVRCPSCSATIRAGSDWCTLCYADLRPPPPATVEPVEAPVQPVVPVEPVASAPEAAEAPEAPEVPDPAVVAPPRGKHAKGAPASAEVAGPTGQVAEAERLAETMLAQLAAAESKHPLGSLAGAVDTSGKRTALMIGGSVAAMCVLFGLMALLGLLL